MCVPFEERVKHGFGVALRAKSMTEALQFDPQFFMIVNLAVEYDGRIFGPDRLVTRVEIDDFQASCAHRTELRLEETLLVGSAVNQRCRRVSNAICVGSPAFIGKTRDSTQVFTPLSVKCRSTDSRALCFVVRCAHAASSLVAE